MAFRVIALRPRVLAMSSSVLPKPSNTKLETGKATSRVRFANDHPERMPGEVLVNLASALLEAPLDILYVHLRTDPKAKLHWMNAAGRRIFTWLNNGELNILP